MLYFINDYSEGAHPRIMEALCRTNFEQHIGYGMDEWCKKAAALIQEKIDRTDVDVHFFVAGTQTNFTALSAFLRPHEAVISSSRGHICVHETGAVEANGHKIIHLSTPDAKLKPEQIDETMSFHCDEHFVKPKAVYITQATELGTIYSKKELQAIREKCDKYGLYLYLDGARLGSALTSEENDLTLPDIAALTDAFYIGGTKNGMLFGEALILQNDALKPDFRWILKQKGGMLAKGRMLGIQFTEMFQDNLYFELAQHANDMAKLLRTGIERLGYPFLVNSPTNQLFPILPIQVHEKLSKQCLYELECPIDETHIAIRFVTSWATAKEDVEKLLQLLKDLKQPT